MLARASVLSCLACLAWSRGSVRFAEDECQTPGLSMLQSRSDRLSSKPWDSRLLYVVTYHKSGSQLMFKVVQRAMSALGADLDRDTCAVDVASRKYWGIQPQSTPCRDLPPDSHHIRLNTGMGSETWQREVSRMQIPSNGLRMVVEKRDPAEQLASAYCYHSSGHENGTWGFSDKYPKIPYDHLAEMDLRDGVAAVAGQVYAELDQTVSLLSVPGLHPLEVRYENFVRSSHDFDRQVHDLLEFMVGDLATSDQIRVAAQAATEEDGHRHAQYVSEHADDPDCVKAAVEVQQSLPEVQGKIQDYQRRLGYL